MNLLQEINQRLRAVPVWTVYVLGALPFFWLVWQAGIGGLGVDPVKGLEHELGKHALQFLLATLAVSPLRWLGLNLVRFRRQIGLVAFAYVLVHFATWLTVDMGLRWDQILADLYKRWYILFGFTALILLVPLAVTSNNLSIRTLGAQGWTQLHKLAYPATILAIVHYLLSTKVLSQEQVVYAGILAVLLAWRLLKLGPRRLFLA